MRTEVVVFSRLVEKREVDSRLSAACFYKTSNEETVEKKHASTLMIRSSLRLVARVLILVAI
jgi:hypothetical protein